MINTWKRNNHKKKKKKKRKNEEEEEVEEVEVEVEVVEEQCSRIQSGDDIKWCYCFTPNEHCFLCFVCIPPRNEVFTHLVQPVNSTTQMGIEIG